MCATHICASMFYNSSDLAAASIVLYIFLFSLEKKLIFFYFYFYENLYGETRMHLAGYIILLKTFVQIFQLLS